MNYQYKRNERMLSILILPILVFLLSSFASCDQGGKKQAKKETSKKPLGSPKLLLIQDLMNCEMA